MIAIERKKLEQVLDALELPSMKTLAMLSQRDQATTAIKEALAQDEQEPVAWIQPGLRDWLCVSYEKDDVHTVPVYPHPPQQQAKPEQEPVAWMHEWEDGGSVLSLYPRDARLNDQPKSVRPLVYGDTAPPKRQPLTPGTIRNMYARHNDPVDFVRAVEKLHGVGG